MDVGRMTGAAGRTWLVAVVVAVAGLGLGTAGARADYQSEQQLASGIGNGSPVAVNALGDVYVADRSDGDLLEVFPDGSETTIAQTGSVEGIAVDAEGDVLLAELGQNGLVQVTPDGAQTTIDTGLGPVGDVVSDGQGDLFALTDNGGSPQVTEVKPDGTETTVAQLPADVVAIAVDGAGDVFANVSTDRGSTTSVIEVFPNGSQRTIVTVSFPGQVFGLATDLRGDLFVAMAGGSVLEYGTDGSQQPSLPGPSDVSGVAVDNDGDVFTTTQDQTLLEFPFTQDATSTSVSCGPSANVDVAQRCTATVSDTDSSDTPTGTVTFSSQSQGAFGNSSASCTLAGGSCWLDYTPYPGDLNTQTITAHYSATQWDAGSTGTASLLVGTLTPSVTMTCARPSASQLKQVSHWRAVSISCTGTVRAPAGMTGVPVPTGLVTFLASPNNDTGEEIEPGRCFLKRSGATARCVTRFVTAEPDDYTLTIDYGGDGIWLPTNGQGTLDLN